MKMRDRYPSSQGGNPTPTPHLAGQVAKEIIVLAPEFPKGRGTVMILHWRGVIIQNLAKILIRIDGSEKV